MFKEKKISVSNKGLKYDIKIRNLTLVLLCSKRNETEEEKKRRICRSGCGVEKSPNDACTPGFSSREQAEIVRDARGHKKFELPRAGRKCKLQLLQTLLRLVQSWRANCDFQFLYYESNPDCPDAEDIAKVTDYIVAYACKGIETVKEEKAQTRQLIMTASENTCCKKDVKRLARQILNRSLGEKLISKQECMVQLAELSLYQCSESFESISLSG